MRESTFPIGWSVREVAAKAIEDYLDGRIDNDELENTIFNPSIQAEDTCREIALELSLYYSDFGKHKNEGKYQIPKEMEQAIRRWIFLLRSDWQWPLDRKDSIPRGLLKTMLGFFKSNCCAQSRVVNNEYWPLDTQLSWTQLEDTYRAETGTT